MDSGGFAVSSRVSYKECQRNHAANTGRHAVDGCTEFMPSGDDGTEHALVCAACGCHRNFHRREAGSVVDSSPANSSTTT